MRPQSMEANEKQIYPFCYQGNNGSQFNLTYFTLLSPLKVEIDLFRVLFSKNNIFLHSWKKIHRNLSEKALQFVDKSSPVHFGLFVSPSMQPFRDVQIVGTAQRDVSRINNEGTGYLPCKSLCSFLPLSQTTTQSAREPGRYHTTSHSINKNLKRRKNGYRCCDKRYVESNFT